MHGVLRIPYEYGGQQYKVFVPFDESSIPDYAGTYLTGVREDGSTCNLTQQPGVTYLFTASQLGVKELRLTMDDNDEKVFTGDQYVVV